jgi:hypothetical protein
MARPNETAPDPIHEEIQDLKDRAHERVDRFGEQAEFAANFTANLAREMTNYAAQLRPALQRSVKHQPMLTLVGVAVVGFVLGKLWRR